MNNIDPSQFRAPIRALDQELDPPNMVGGGGFMTAIRGRAVPFQTRMKFLDKILPYAIRLVCNRPSIFGRVLPLGVLLVPKTARPFPGGHVNTIVLRSASG